jgi:hypothetical protein
LVPGLYFVERDSGSTVPRRSLLFFGGTAPRSALRPYAERMMTYAWIYEFWRYVSNLEMLYTPQFRPLARALTER